MSCRRAVSLICTGTPPRKSRSKTPSLAHDQILISHSGDRYYKVLDKIIAENVVPGQTKFQKWVNEKDIFSTRAYLMFQEKE